jgi:hypothetical protein
VGGASSAPNLACALVIWLWPELQVPCFLSTSDAQGGMSTAHQDLFSPQFLSSPLRCCVSNSSHHCCAGAAHLSPAVDPRFDTAGSVPCINVLA